MSTTRPTPPIHPKVKAAAVVSLVLLALDGAVTAVQGHVPSPTVTAVLAVLHAVLPVLAGYWKAA